MNLNDESQCDVVGVGKLVGQSGRQLVTADWEVAARWRRTSHHGGHVGNEAVQIHGVHVSGRVLRRQCEYHSGYQLCQLID